MSAATGPFGCIQFEYGHLLGPPDGRYLVRSGGEALEWVLVLNTLGAPPRRTLRTRKGNVGTDADPEPVPTARATVVRPEAFDREERADAWLTRLRADPDALDDELATALEVVNRAVSSYRTAAANPYLRDVDRAGALAVRVGFGVGPAVADGRFDKVWELPRAKGGAKRSMEAPDERFAALLGGRESRLACEELTMRARADLDAGRTREAALQAAAALETLLAEIPKLADRRRAALEDDRDPAATAAAQARTAELSGEETEAVTAMVGRLEGALRAYRIGVTD